MCWATEGNFRSLWIWAFEMYHGAFKAVRRTLFCRVWMRFIVEGAAPPHIGAAYVIAGSTSDLYKCSVVLRLRDDFLLIRG